MPTINRTFWTGVKEYVIITLGILLYVTGWLVFLLPNNLVGGGITGVSSIIQYGTHGLIKAGYSYFIINIVLVIIAIFILGRSFGSKSVYAIIVASIGLSFGQDIVPQEFCRMMAVDNGKLMSTIMGGLIVGVGIGMSISQGGSSGGTDIIALIVNKYRNISPGRMILWMDAVIILSSLAVPSFTQDGNLVPFTEKITTVVYGFILVAVTSTTLDLYLAGSKQSVQLFILSKKYDQIADAITKELHRGVTVLDGKGWFTKEETQVLMVITRKSNLNLYLQYVKTIDPDAFLSVSYVTGVYGRGFDAIKMSGKKNKV